MENQQLFCHASRRRIVIVGESTITEILFVPKRIRNSHITFFTNNHAPFHLQRKKNISWTFWPPFSVNLFSILNLDIHKNFQKEVIKEGKLTTLLKRSYFWWKSWKFSCIHFPKNLMFVVTITLFFGNISTGCDN